MNQEFIQVINQTLQQIRDDGFYKSERVIVSPQGTEVGLAQQNDVINMCANNYLGLANDARLVSAAKQALDEDGFGMASVRFICGTQSVHKELEKSISDYLGTEDTILFSSCFDANAAVFEVLLTENDAVISDVLNHASIIDGVRLCKAARYRYQNNNAQDLEQQLIAAKAAGAKFMMVVTDGVFSMDGVIADLAAICEAAKKYGALVMVDDSHAVGFIGPKGSGTAAYHQVTEQIAVFSGTLGKALGGAAGGYLSGPAPIIELLRQRARPYLFSNSLTPSIAAASLAAIKIAAGEEGDALRAQLKANALRFKSQMQAAGFELLAGEHPIIPVMLGDAKVAKNMADALLAEGVYVIGFSYPVVPKGRARIRTQMSASHTFEQIDRAVAAFIKVGRQLGVI